MSKIDETTNKNSEWLVFYMNLELEYFVGILSG